MMRMAMFPEEVVRIAVEYDYVEEAALLLCNRSADDFCVVY
jgi:hypothetical protein